MFVRRGLAWIGSGGIGILAARLGLARLGLGWLDLVRVEACLGFGSPCWTWFGSAWRTKPMLTLPAEIKGAGLVWLRFA